MRFILIVQQIMRSLYDVDCRALTRPAAPAVMKFTILVWPSLAIITKYIYFICSRVERNIASLYDLWSCPSIRNITLGVILLTILVVPYLVIITIYFVWFMPKSGEDEFIKYITFTTSYPKLYTRGYKI